MLNFTTPLPWWDARQYVEDYTSGNATLRRMLRGFLYLGYFYGTLALKPEIWRTGSLALRSRSNPVGRFSLSQTSRNPACRSTRADEPAESPARGLVRVKPYEEILAT